MKQKFAKFKKHIIYTAEVFFALITAYILIYAFYHRDSAELVYIIFNSYALLAVILSFCFVLYWQHMRRKREIEQREGFVKLTKSLASPAMLWDSKLTTVVLSPQLIELAELTEPKDGFDAQYIVPWLFSKDRIDEDDIDNMLKMGSREYSFIAKSGEPHDIIWSTSAVGKDPDGVSWYLSIGLDLAQMHKMESEIESYSRRLSASEGKQMLTMELTDIGILLIEQGSQTIFASEKLQKMWGLASNSITVSELREKIYPPDVAAYDRLVMTLHTRMGQMLEKGSDETEMRICSADGQYRWYSYRFKVRPHATNGRLIVGGSVMDITDQKEKDAQIQRIAYEDSVTGIPNRNSLMRMGKELYECAVEIGSSYWVIVMDIDRFHIINDTCGYETGNELLKAFADTMNRQLSVGGFGARISGDNFALILHDVGEADLPEKVVRRMQRTLATQAVGALSNRTLGCSAGYAKMPQDGASFEEVLEHAEFALSAGAHTGGSIERYTQAMHDSIIYESNLERELASGVMNNQLVLYYQPKVSAKTGAVTGLEALVRWKKPNGELVQPSVFIPIAERSQLITHITRFVMYEACRQARLWQRMGLPPIVMSINFSSADFYQENACAEIAKCLERNDLDPQFLEVELTESMALKDIDMTVAQMRQMRELGIKLAMDDFGTGYSSLSYIQMLPFTMIKLDRSFVIRMEDDVVVQEIIRSVIQIAKAKRIETIAEGVETQRQADQLREAGCDYIQGYLYGKPMSASDTELFIRQNAPGRA